MTLTAESTVPAPAVPEAVPGGRPRWVTPALLALLAATAVLYLWSLGSSGWANSYYAAAVQAGTQDLTAWLFGSHDAGNAITVDKPPAALWVMALSGRLFGFSPFTMLLPQALMGVGAVALLFATVRRCGGEVAGLIAGAVLAVTPVAALMFRFNNPDALLVLLLVLAAFFTVRGIESAGTKWMVLAGCAIGFAFLTKMLQAFLVVPGFALAFLVAAPVGLWQRIWKLLAGAAALMVSAAWYVALVELWPAESRPYIGGSTDNSLLQLALGYNGIQRLAGHGGLGGSGGPPVGPPPGGPGGPGLMGNVFFGGEPGLGRMFGMSMGTEASWLLPAALIGLAAALWLTRRAVRTDHVRASLLLWGGWLLATAAVFSFMDGIIHPYYTVALAPGVAAVVGISVAELWRARSRVWVRSVLATMSAATGVWAYVLLHRTPDWLPALRWIVLIGALVAAVWLVVVGSRTGRVATVAAAVALAFAVAAPAAYSVETVKTSHRGPMSISGPSRADAMGPPPGAGGRVADNAALVELIRDRENRWAAATIGSHMASDLELQTGASIMAIGGFTGADESPTLTQFQEHVADREVRYFISGGHFGPPGHREAGAAAEITAWVKANFRPMTVGGVTVYDLQQSA